MDTLLTLNSSATLDPAPPSNRGRRSTAHVALSLLIIAAGILFRVRYFVARASFWRDEAFIVLNIRDHLASELIGPLEHGQASPPLFLFAERAMAVAFGTGEYSLRAVPLVCGIAGLILFSILARRLLRAPTALCAIAMMAFAEKFILYSAEVKQYSGDVMMAVLLLLAATEGLRLRGLFGRADSRWASSPSTGTPGEGRGGGCVEQAPVARTSPLPNPPPEYRGRGQEASQIFSGTSPLRRLALASLLASVGIWFSHASILVFGAIGLVLTLACWRIEKRQALQAIAVMLPFAISFVILDLISIRPQNTAWMHFYWITDFPDLYDPLAIPGWVLLRLYDLLGAAFPMIGPLLALVTGLGIIGLVRARKYELLGLLIGPTLVAIAASLMQRYPFNATRLTLFLLPQVFLLCGAGFEFLEETLPRRAAWAWWALAAPIVAVGLGVSVSRFIQPHFRSHIRPAVVYLREHRQPGEAIYLTGMPALIGPDPWRGRDLELLCYWPHPPPPLHELSRMNWSNVPERKFWVIFAFDPDRKNSWRESLMTDLRESATEQTHFVDPRGGAAYLFERAPQSPRD